MSQLSENIKYLRKSKGMTQQSLADALFLNRPVIGAYEENRAEPKLETLKKISELFQIPLEDLLSKNLESKTHLDSKLEEKSPLKVLSITVDSENRENIEWVPLKASAGYLNGFADTEFMSTLSKFQLPMLKEGTYRAFEIKGDSMLPLLSGTFIIGEYVEDWKYIKDGETYIILSREEGIVYKRVFRDEKNKSLKLVSDNITYEPYSVPAQEILEIWKAKAYISTQMPKPQNVNSIEKIGEILVELQKSMNQLNN